MVGPPLVAVRTGLAQPPDELVQALIGVMPGSHSPQPEDDVPGEAVQYVRRRPDVPALFEIRVPGGAEPGEHRDLFPAQSQRAPARTDGQADIHRVHALASAAQEMREFPAAALLGLAHGIPPPVARNRPERKVSTAVRGAFAASPTNSMPVRPNAFRCIEVTLRNINTYTTSGHGEPTCVSCRPFRSAVSRTHETVNSVYIYL